MQAIGEPPVKAASSLIYPASNIPDSGSYANWCVCSTTYWGLLPTACGKLEVDPGLGVRSLGWTTHGNLLSREVMRNVRPTHTPWWEQSLETKDFFNASHMLAPEQPEVFIRRMRQSPKPRARSAPQVRSSAAPTPIGHFCCPCKIQDITFKRHSAVRKCSNPAQWVQPSSGNRPLMLQLTSPSLPQHHAAKTNSSKNGCWTDRHAARNKLAASDKEKVVYCSRGPLLTEMDQLLLLLGFTA